MVSNVLLFLINLRLGEVFREQTESLFEKQECNFVWRYFSVVTC